MIKCIRAGKVLKEFLAYDKYSQLESLYFESLSIQLHIYPVSYSIIHKFSLYITYMHIFC